MKKILSFFAFLLLFSLIAFATDGQRNIPEQGTWMEDPDVIESDEEESEEMEEDEVEDDEKVGQGKGQDIKKDEKGDTLAQQKLQAREEAKEQNRNKLQQGLNNALTHVENENARQRLEQNIIRFQEKYQERMHKLEDLEIEEVDNETGAAKIRAKEEVRFFGFIKGKATKRFEIDNQGNISEKHPWYRFMYRETE